MRCGKPPILLRRLAMPGVVGLLLAAFASTGARAQDFTPAGIPIPSIATSLPANGDASGARKRLAEQGITYQFIYTNDVLGNVSGGLKRGFIDQGKLEFDLNIDFEKLANLRGLSFYANGFFIHNTGRIRRDYVGGVNTIAAIEARGTTRLSELWLEQKLWNEATTLRIGQLAADVEFFYSDWSQLFLQSDWATITALNLASGGPAYPLSTPGIRFKTEPAQDVTWLLAIYNGDPAGPGTGDEQLRNRYGLNFRVQDPAFVMTEAQLRTNFGKEDTGLARILRLGAWGHLGKFNDQRYANDGTLLSNPLGSGIAAKLRGDWGLYAVIDQQIWRPKGGAPDSGIGVFSRISGSPSDRNQISFYIDGGIVFSGLIPGRPDDKFGASVIYARYSDALRAADLDKILAGYPGYVRDYEANLELTYQAQIVPGWTVQPVITRVWHPSGDASRNALVVGVRSILRY